MIITSRQHEVVRAYRRAARGDGDLALIDGWHLLHEADSSRIAIVELAVTAAPLPPASQSLVERAARRGARVVTVAASVMDAISPVRTPSGVAALVRRIEHPLSAALKPAPALAVVAIDLQDPGNAGAVVRAAEAGGATGVILAGESADPWGWKALRAAMGSTFRLPVVRTSDPDAVLREMREAGVRNIATVPRGGTPLHDLEWTGPIAVLFGAEGAGLDPRWQQAADAAVSIPMRAPVESLNAAVAAALVIYEADRQRRLRSVRA